MVTGDQIPGGPEEAFPFPEVECRHRRVVLRVEAFHAHALAAGLAVTGWIGVVDVVPEAVHRVPLAELLRLPEDEVPIGATRTQKLPRDNRTLVSRRGFLVQINGGNSAVLFPHVPFGMLFGVCCRPTDGEVERTSHSYFVAGLDLLAQQIKLQVGMLAADRRRIVAPAVVALGKEVDPVDVA